MNGLPEEGALRARERVAYAKLGLDPRADFTVARLAPAADAINAY